MSPTGERVLVAMSGGVDSSVAAALLRRAGADVVGVFMRLGTSDDPRIERASGDACEAGTGPAPARPARGCCSVSDAADARLVAGHLDIPLYVCNFRRDFDRVIGYFVDEYASGRTPNPCVRCNDWLKFGRLHELARQLGAGAVASGHYARIEARAPGVPGGPLVLKRAVDRAKDQSDVLFGIPRELLGATRFPLGAMTKPEVRALARELGLPVHDKPDSQEICFVPDDDYAALVERRRPDLARAGAVLDEDGRAIGMHAGHHRYTLGQRRGVPVALGHRVYVVAKDPVANTVTVGGRATLRTDGLVAGEVNWLTDAPPPGTPVPCLARFRHAGTPVPARFEVLADGDAGTPSGRRGRVAVTFDTPQDACTPGQAVVLYDAGDAETVLAGGWISGPLPRR